MVTEASANLGVSPYILRKWIAEDDKQFWPSRTVMFGKTKVYLYTDADLERIGKAYAEQRADGLFDGRQSNGRPRRFTDEERKQRGRLQSRRHYWKIRAAEALFAEDDELLRKATDEVKKINKQLRGK